MGTPRWLRVKEVFQDAVIRPPDARAAFLDEACEADAELRREVESLLVSHDEAGRFLSEPAPGDALAEDSLEQSPLRTRVGPYRVLNVIAHGGMGTVYRAVRDDDAFEKTVALKLVRGGAGSEFTDRRFRQERQILARLQHPNIATVLDGGATEEGQPYLVMEHVDGRPITAYCDERGLSTRERLALFGRICDAIQYAHQNLVVHRDLKPDNVLVTTDGTPKLLDFGIAKLLAVGVDPDAAPTATLLPMMTPQYASPEQVRGQPVTTASDVYSLGALLYELLTGSRPYVVKADSMEEIVHSVCDTEPAPPSSAIRSGSDAGKRPTASELKGDLDTIVLRALSKEPARRYGSAHALADDIRRYLDGRPVLARPDTLGYRAGKFVRRHRVMVTAGALVAASLLAGLFATVRQRREAEQQRARAERRFADVRRLANSLLFDLEGAIRDLPGATPARQLVVRKALEYLDSLAEEASGDVVLQAELAAAYQKVGDVQGDPFGANLGDTAGAIESYRKEVAIREALAARPQRARQVVVDLASAYRRLGLLEDEAGETEAGVVHLNEALDLAEGLVADDPTDHVARRASANANDGAGLLALKTGDHAGAEERQRRALAIWEAEVIASPEDREALRGLSLIHGELARTLRVTGRLPEATEHYRRALDAAQRRLRLLPDDLVARRDESNSYGNLAVALYTGGEIGEAARDVARSLAFDEEMLRADPKNSQVQRDVSWDLDFLAELASAGGKLEEALAFQQRGLDLDRARATASPGSFQARKDLAESWSSVSDLLYRLQRLEPALQASSQSLVAFEELRKENPDQTRVQQLTAAQYGRHAAVLDALSTRAARTGAADATLQRDACVAYRASLRLWRELSSKGAAIDEENRQHVVDTEAAVTRCDPLLAGR